MMYVIAPKAAINDNVGREKGLFYAFLGLKMARFSNFHYTVGSSSVVKSISFGPNNNEKLFNGVQDIAQSRPK